MCNYIYVWFSKCIVTIPCQAVTYHVCISSSFEVRQSKTPLIYLNHFATNCSQILKYPNFVDFWESFPIIQQLCFESESQLLNNFALHLNHNLTTNYSTIESKIILLWILSGDSRPILINSYNFIIFSSKDFLCNIENVTGKNIHIFNFKPF